MISVLLASRNEHELSGLDAALNENSMATTRAESGAEALDMMLDGAFDLLIVDEALGDMTGIELIAETVSRNPMMNCAAVSSLSHEDFHEASEGLGVMMQLPVRPGREDAKALIDYLKTILNLTRGAAA